MYGATKIFVEKFSRDLYAEVKEQGIVVQTIHPGRPTFNFKIDTLKNIYDIIN